MFLLMAIPAKADVGIRMFLFNCDKENNRVAFEPFILWNGNTTFHDSVLEDPMKNLTQKQGVDTFYAYTDSRWEKNNVLELECDTGTRVIKAILKNKQLEINEISEGMTTSVKIDLDMGICSAWDVHGPTYRLKSDKAGVWDACFGREDQGDKSSTKCFPAAATVPADDASLKGYSSYFQGICHPDRAQR